MLGKMKEEEEKGRKKMVEWEFLFAIITFLFLSSNIFYVHVINNKFWIIYIQSSNIFTLIS